MCAQVVGGGRECLCVREMELSMLDIKKKKVQYIIQPTQATDSINCATHTHTSCHFFQALNFFKKKTLHHQNTIGIVMILELKFLAEILFYRWETPSNKKSHLSQIENSLAFSAPRLVFFLSPFFSSKLCPPLFSFLLRTKGADTH